MLIRRPADIAPSEITAPALFASRREFIKAASLGTIAGALGMAGTPTSAEPAGGQRGQKLEGIVKSRFSIDEKLTPCESITSYGNFYEFGPDKDSPGKHAHRLRTRPWTVRIEGEVERPQIFAIDDILKWAPLEERICRLRCVVPWKYGFKSAKSIVKIRFVREAPRTSWMRAGPSEYGFYSNVNPEVEHPRWSQANERRLGEFLKRKTLMFNGYADQVAQLYGGMDLRKNF